MKTPETHTEAVTLAAAASREHLEWLIGIVVEKLARRGEKDGGLMMPLPDEAIEFEGRIIAV